MIEPSNRSFAGKELRVIGADGEQLGILKFEDVKARAKETEMDMVLVSENSTPPVCRLMDYGKLVYEQRKKVKDQKKHHHAQKQKEIKFRVSIDPHDYGYKLNHCVEFLEKGHKLKVTLMFRGREMAHKDIGFDLVNKIIEDLKEYGVADSTPKLMGRNISVSFSPTKGHHN